MKKTILRREDGEPYLIRYSFPFGIKLHHILKSDDACMHDHPWGFVSVILRGGYTEQRVVEWHSLDDYNFEKHGSNFIVDPSRDRFGIWEKKWYGVGSILKREPNSTHRLELSKPCWTLVFTGKKVKQWGFFSVKGWIPWYRYKQNQNQCE
jgi:hypothetical protein